MQTDWLKITSSIRYTDFIQTVARVKSQGATQQKVTVVSTQKRWLRKKTTHSEVSIKELKRAVLDFVDNGKVDGKPLDLRYKPGLVEEKAYSEKFGSALASWLNAKGFRRDGEPFTGENVMNALHSQFFPNDRYMQESKKNGTEAPFPMGYVTSSAKNAMRFGVGNCEECGCSAISMLLSNSELTKGAGDARIELIEAKVAGDSHYFVLLNRSGATNPLQDFANWFNDPNVVVCDPWVTDRGVGGKITSNSGGMRELREYLQPDLNTRPSILRVRWEGVLGQEQTMKVDPKFVLS